MIKKSLLAIALLGASSTVVAGPYIGGGFGTVDVDVPGFDDPTGFEIIIGNEVSPGFAIEASIIDFGEASDGIPPEWNLSANTIAFGGVLKSTTAENAEVFLKIGVHLWDLELKEDGFGLLGEDDGSDIFYGFGMAFDLNEQLSMGVRYNSYAMDDLDVTMISINALVSF